jgi:L-fuconate dehydratase
MPIRFVLLFSPGYSDEKIARLTKEAIQAGFNHFKMKVGADLADDLRRGKLIRSIIDDPQWYHPPGDPEFARRRRLPADGGGGGGGPELAGKNAGPTGAVLMIDANQVWDVQQAIDYVSLLAEIKPWYAHPTDYALSFFFSRLSSTPSVSSKESKLTNDSYVCARTWSIRFIEEPTAPDDILGHAAIRSALKPHGIGVATGEHAHNRMVFKQLFQA